MTESAKGKRKNILQKGQTPTIHSSQNIQKQTCSETVRRGDRDSAIYAS